MTRPPIHKTRRAALWTCLTLALALGILSINLLFYTLLQHSNQAGLMQVATFPELDSGSWLDSQRETLSPIFPYDTHPDSPLEPLSDGELAILLPAQSQALDGWSLLFDAITSGFLPSPNALGQVSPTGNLSTTWWNLSPNQGMSDEEAKALQLGTKRPYVARLAVDGGSWRVLRLSCTHTVRSGSGQYWVDAVQAEDTGILYTFRLYPAANTTGNLELNDDMRTVILSAAANFLISVEQLNRQYLSLGGPEGSLDVSNERLHRQGLIRMPASLYGNASLQPSSIRTQGTSCILTYPGGDGDRLLVYYDLTLMQVTGFSYQSD